MSDEIRILQENEFPELLSEIPDSPKQLYIRGNYPSKEFKFLCVVGSRKYSQYGKDICTKLIEGLSGHNIVIVSGLALGIDSIAHRVALENNIKTLAVPGSGLDDSVLYPSSHRNLAKQILKNEGTLISEFEPKTPAAPYTFPQRNRIMAGISHAVLVIEATEKSGTLITSRLATDYNRDVLTVPGSIFSPNSHGPHMLIKLGATPILNSDDILRALDIEITNKKLDTSSLSKLELQILELLKTPMSRDEITSVLSIPISQVNVILSAMELKGLVEEKLGKIHNMVITSLTE